MVGLIFLFLLIAFMIWVLFTPLIIRIDTRKNQYDLRLVGLFRTWPSIEDDEFIINIVVPFYKVKIRPLEQKKKPKKESKEKKPATKGPDIKQARRFWQVMRSFRISVFKTSIDTDDYILNAQLVPLGQFLRSRGVDVNVNFNGESYLQLEIRNRLWRIGTAYLGITKY